MVPEGTPINVPELATSDDTQGVLEACVDLERAGESAVLDATKTTMFGPIGVTLLASIVAERRESSRPTHLLRPVDEEAARFLKEIQFDRFVEGKETDTSSTVTVRQLKALDPYYTDEAARVICDGVPGMDEASAYTVQLCLNELLQNVFEWSGSSIGCIALTRWYHRTRSVRMAVVDRGVGIPARLRGGRIADLHRESDADVIAAAVTRQHLTSRIGRPGGLGLKTIHGVVTGRGGRLMVISHGARVAWSGSRRMTTLRIPWFRGTGIEIEFRPDMPIQNPNEYVAVF